MLFNSTIRKELVRNLSGIFAILLSIVLVMLFIVSLRLASKGVFSPTDILPEAGLRIVVNFSTLLSLSLFLAIAATLGRMYKENEVTIWQTSGQSLLKFIRPIMRFAMPFLVIIGLTSLILSPLANKQINNLHLSFKMQSDLSKVNPNTFQFSSDGSKVFFIEKDSLKSPIAKNIFVVNYEKGKISIISAKKAELIIKNNLQYLKLTNGQNTETITKTDDKNNFKWLMQTFSTYQLTLSQQAEPEALSEEKTLRQTSSIALLGPGTSADGKAELAWRIGILLASFNCIILALAITNVNPRQKYNFSLGICFLSFFAYYNCLLIGSNLISAGKFGVISWTILLHGSVFILAVLLLYKRHRNWTLADLVTTKFKS